MLQMASHTPIELHILLDNVIMKNASAQHLDSVPSSLTMKRKHVLMRGIGISPFFICRYFLWEVTGALHSREQILTQFNLNTTLETEGVSRRIYLFDVYLSSLPMSTMWSTRVSSILYL